MDLDEIACFFYTLSTTFSVERARFAAVDGQNTLANLANDFIREHAWRFIRLFCEPRKESGDTFFLVGASTKNLL